MTDYSDIIERLEKADGPSKELGGEVLLACGWDKRCTGHFYGPMYYWSPPDLEESHRGFDDDDFNRYDPTRSLDAAIALVERLLPGKRPTLAQNAIYGHWSAFLVWFDDERGVTEKSHSACHVSAAIALLTALFCALQAQGRTDNQ